MAVQDDEAHIDTTLLEDEGPPIKAMTIGAVCKAIEQEFPDISISKIRYLEDQKLLSPRRTPGGYRLYSSGDVARLRTILRLQRDEFLPLRVIRQELAAGRADEAEAAVPAPTGRGGRPRRASVSVRDAGAWYSLDDVTVSRDHALLVRRSGDYYLDDLGSLNGTYVNRHRIE
ncbi:MAG: hypothetical protein QOD73_1080, partial [Solirubrobacteraceae bacterium]|nr:hypothetical protein [Solirubrobacteraceae bacterium]